MNKFFRSLTFTFLIITLFVVSSCIKSDEDNRTEDTEKIEISKYILAIENKGYDVDTTSSGLYYVMHKEGLGSTLNAQDSAFIEYVGYFINETIFDASAYHFISGIWGFIYKGHDLFLIDGFDEAIGMMKIGGEATFIIPSNLAYGSGWHDNIPPFTPLVFNINRHESAEKPDTNE